MLELLSQGLTLMCIGMGVVFAFLGLLVFLTQQLSYWVNKLSPEVSSRPVNDSLEDSELIVVISTAIQQYRNTESKNNNSK